MYHRKHSGFVTLGPSRDLEAGARLGQASHHGDRGEASWAQRAADRHGDPPYGSRCILREVQAGRGSARGDTEVCKSAYAKAHFDAPLIVRRPDDLKRITGGTDGIIFDDCDFSKWSPEDAICLLDWDKARSLPARYSDAFIEADVPLIFTTNRRPHKIFPRSPIAKQRRAIKRRYRAVEITTCLAAIGRPFTAREKRMRREAGASGARNDGLAAPDDVGAVSSEGVKVNRRL